jgi:ketosteroid isomerase-like protein
MSGDRDVGSVLRALTGIVLLALAAWTPATPGGGFQTFLTKFEVATRSFLNGDAAPWKQIASHGNDVTIMGAWGAYEKGWGEVGARYDWAVRRFVPSGAQMQVEYLASGESGDLAYTVAIERSTVRVIGEEKPASMSLRVTHLFRKEKGEWRLIHRHADPLMGKTAPAATLDTN